MPKSKRIYPFVFMFTWYICFKLTCVDNIVWQSSQSIVCIIVDKDVKTRCENENFFILFPHYFLITFERKSAKYRLHQWKCSIGKRLLCSYSDIKPTIFPADGRGHCLHRPVPDKRFLFNLSWGLVPSHTPFPTWRRRRICRRPCLKTL